MEQLHKLCCVRIQRKYCYIAEKSKEYGKTQLNSISYVKYLTPYSVQEKYA